MLYKLSNPYRTQRNNRIGPTQTCQVTSMIMALEASGIAFEYPKDEQPEDYLARLLKKARMENSEGECSDNLFLFFLLLPLRVFFTSTPATCVFWHLLSLRVFLASTLATCFLTKFTSKTRNFWLVAFRLRVFSLTPATCFLTKFTSKTRN